MAFAKAQGCEYGFDKPQGRSSSSSQPHMGPVQGNGNTEAVSAPNISYAGSPFSWTYNVAIAAADATNSGGASTDWTVTAGALPTGISLNATTGQLTGTPTLEGYTQTAEITATNGGGSDAATITWSVARAPAISYAGSPFSWTYNSAISTANVTSTGGQVSAGGYAVQSGSLPTGISLNTSTGALTGTPTLEGYTQAVTIRATGPGGTGDAAITWSVNRAPVIAYTGSPFTWYFEVTTVSLAVSSTGGQVTSYAVQSGTLPTGVSLVAGTGAITGTPTAIKTAADVTIRATGPGGTGDATINIAVLGPASVANLYGWHDFATIGTLWQDSGKTTAVSADGDVIGAAADRSGNNRDETQGTLGNKPTYQTNEINGRSVAQFDGSDDALSGCATLDAAITVFMVGRVLTGYSSLNFFWNHTSANAGIRYATTQKFQYFSNSGGTGETVGGADDTAALIVVKIVSDSQVVVYLNGNQVADFDPNDAAQSTANCALGARTATGTGALKCQWGEHLVYEGALSDADRGIVEDYLQAKWATP